MANAVDDFLAHYGIKGMRWGIRRNDDGTTSRTGKRTKGSDDYETSRELVKRGPKDLSNAELRTVNDRYQLEKTYKELVSSQSALGKIKKGNQQVKDVMAIGDNANKLVGFIDSPAGRLVKQRMGL